MCVLFAEAPHSLVSTDGYVKLGCEAARGCELTLRTSSEKNAEVGGKQVAVLFPDIIVKMNPSSLRV